MSSRWLAARMLAWVAMVGGLGGVASAQILPTSPIELGDGRVTVSADASFTYSCAATAGEICNEDTGFFNYSDYEHSTLRMVRLDVSAAVRANRVFSVLTEVRTENGGLPDPYALYVRIHPWENVPLDFQAGRVPPTFGAFSRRAYSSDNPLIGYPLAYQYLTSLRPDSIAADADELLRMRGRGWLSDFSVGSRIPDRGLPLATAFEWDTGAQVHGTWRWLDATGSVTNGSLGHPLFLEDNNGKQLAGRLAARPIPGLVAGVSVSRGAFLTTDAVESAGATSSRRFPQTAFGSDLEYSRDHYLVRMENVWSQWTLPTITTPLHSDAIMIEGRYKFHPAWHVAARFDHLWFSDVTGTSQTASWDAPVARVELGGGYLVRRNLQMKMSWQHNERDGGRVHDLNIVAAQLAVWF